MAPGFVVHVDEANVITWARRWRAAMITGLLVLIAGFAWLLAVAPPFVAFGLAVASAVAWCIWLETHPEPTLAGGSESTLDQSSYAAEHENLAASFTLVAAASGRKAKRPGGVGAPK